MNRRTLRKAKNAAFLLLSLIATMTGLACLAAILWTLLSHGLAGMSWHLFTQMTPPPGSQGGLLNAIYGSAVMTLLGILIGSPIGVLAGTYLAEYGRKSRLSTVIRFINDVLLSAPSIIIGLFVYEIVVVRMGHFSAIAGALALAILAIPVTLADHGRHAQSGAGGHEGFLRGPRRLSLAHHDQRAVSRPPAAGSSRDCCWPSRASAERPRRCCSPRSTISFGARTSMPPWRICRSSSSSSP